MHSWTSLLLPVNPLHTARAHKAAPFLFTAVQADSTAQHVAGLQRQTLSLSKPNTGAAPGATLRDKQLRWSRQAAVPTNRYKKAWVETLVVVEGPSDQCAVRKAVPAQVCHSLTKSTVQLRYQQQVYTSWLREPNSTILLSTYLFHSKRVSARPCPGTDFTPCARHLRNTAMLCTAQSFASA